MFLIQVAYAYWKLPRYLGTNGQVLIGQKRAQKFETCEAAEAVIARSYFPGGKPSVIKA